MERGIGFWECISYAKQKNRKRKVTHAFALDIWYFCLFVATFFSRKRWCWKKYANGKGEEFPLDVISPSFFSFLEHIWSEQNKKTDLTWGRSGSKISRCHCTKLCKWSMCMSTFLQLLIDFFQSDVGWNSLYHQKCVTFSQKSRHSHFQLNS